ncbi:hypothetical protein PRO82_000012 [Candidatus Protochlamydia amoebophila]|nr:hypothetical protein [Candidatus Protochlamydia amoebophila]
MKCGKKKVFKGHHTLLRVSVQIAASRNYQGELLIVLTNVCPYKALKMYKKRWGEFKSTNAVSTINYKDRDSNFCLAIKPLYAYPIIARLCVLTYQLYADHSNFVA